LIDILDKLFWIW